MKKAIQTMLLLALLGSPPMSALAQEKSAADEKILYMAKFTPIVKL